MPHLVSRDSKGNYVPHYHPEAVTEQVSGVLIHVRSWNDEPRIDGCLHAADMWVPVEHVDDIIDKSLSNKHRVGRVFSETGAPAGEDRAWDHCQVWEDGHNDGPGGPNQLWLDDVPDGVIVRFTHPLPATMPEGVNV